MCESCTNLTVFGGYLPKSFKKIIVCRTNRSGRHGEGGRRTGRQSPRKEGTADPIPGFRRREAACRKRPGTVHVRAGRVNARGPEPGAPGRGGTRDPYERLTGARNPALGVRGRNIDRQTVEKDRENT